MRTRVPLAGLATCGLALCLTVPALAGDPSPKAERPDIKADRPETPSERPKAEGDLPTNRPIIAKVVEVDEDAGRVTLDTAHGQVAVSVSPELAERLSPGDVVVIRLNDEESDSPSASPPDEPSPKERAPLERAPGTKI